jgi:hypothetical protein
LPERRLVLPSSATTSAPQRREYIAHPTTERGFELLRVNQTEQAFERVVRRNALFRLEGLPKPVQFLVRPGFNFHESVRSRQNTTDGDHQNFDQIVTPLLRLPWVGHGHKYVYPSSPSFF